jgi:hypothetical protein
MSTGNDTPENETDGVERHRDWDSDELPYKPLTAKVVTAIVLLVQALCLLVEHWMGPCTRVF